MKPKFFSHFLHKKHCYLFSENKKMNYYDLLNIGSAASKVDIKKAFHKMG